MSDIKVPNEIAAAETPLEAVEVAKVMYRALFETGPSRLSDTNRFIVIGTLAAGLIEWKKQFDKARTDEAQTWKKKYEDTKAELDDVKLKLAILQKEQ